MYMQDDCAQHGGEMPTTLVVAGGVAANSAVREGLTAVAAEFGIPCMYPPIKCVAAGLIEMRLAIADDAPSDARACLLWCKALQHERVGASAALHGC